MAASVGKLAGFAILATSLVALSPQAHADEFQTVVGAGFGAVTGALIGNSIGGRNGAILGAGAGGLVGASIANQRNYSPGYAPNPYPVANTYYQQPVAVYQAAQPQYRVIEPTVYYRQPVTVYQAPPPQYRVVQPVTYYQPSVYVTAPSNYYWREEYRHHHHHGYNGYRY